MKNTKPESSPAKVEAAGKDGFFKRIVGRIDRAMKDKAERASKGGCGCGDDKGGKCC